MECALCKKAIFVTEANKELCPTCFKMMQNWEIVMCTRYQAQGHTLKCSLIRSKGRKCICGKTKYFKGFISKMIKKNKSNLTCNFNTL